MSEAKRQAWSLWAGRRAGVVESTGRALGPLHLRLWLRRAHPLVEVRLQAGCSCELTISPGGMNQTAASGHLQTQEEARVVLQARVYLIFWFYRKGNYYAAF